jgi:hypothetical protein
MGVIFDEDHDFEGPRAPKAHLDTVLTKRVTPPGQALLVRHMCGSKTTLPPPAHTDRTCFGQ